MSIASKNRKRKKRLRRLYENIVEAKVMRQVLEAQHEARIAKENELKIRKTLDEEEAALIVSLVYSSESLQRAFAFSFSLLLH